MRPITVFIQANSLSIQSIADFSPAIVMIYDLSTSRSWRRATANSSQPSHKIVTISRTICRMSSLCHISNSQKSYFVRHKTRINITICVFSRIFTFTAVKFTFPSIQHKNIAVKQERFKIAVDENSLLRHLNWLP